MVRPPSHWVTRVALVALLPLLTGATADISRYRAPLTNTGLLGVTSTEPLPPGYFAATTTFGYAHKPLVWRYDDDSYSELINNTATMNLVLSAGALRFVDVAVDVPFTLRQTGPADGGLGDLAGNGIGDIRLMGRLQLADERSFGYGGAFVLEVAMPTGDGDKFFGEEGITWRPRVIMSAPSKSGRLIGSLGYTARSDSLVDEVNFEDELEFKGGFDFAVRRGERPISILAEVAAVIPRGDNGLTAEVLTGARARVAEDIVVTAGVGAGLTRTAGSPVFRGLLGVSFQPIADDADLDGIPDDLDACRVKPEDWDGFEDQDGCPDKDNDRDGVWDKRDQCPDTPEDLNGFEDNDGCPDAHTLDTDKDGIMDSDDQCPTQPEDMDDFQDDDGCIDYDNDFDGITDDKDKCPEDKETINGVEDYDGCPDEGIGLTVLVEQRINIKETILFESGKAILKDESKPVLDQVALVLLAHPEILTVRIEGHTDSRGDEEDNLYLSQDRADAVRRYLIERGVDKGRLEAEGFGETVPIDTNDTVEGRANNRRVDFVITDSEE